MAPYPLLAKSISLALALRNRQHGVQTFRQPACSGPLQALAVGLDRGIRVFEFAVDVAFDQIADAVVGTLALEVPGHGQRPIRLLGPHAECDQTALGAEFVRGNVQRPLEAALGSNVVFALQIGIGQPELEFDGSGLYQGHLVEG